MTAKLPQYDYDIIIIGGGPAGYSAGIYAARAGLKTLLVEGASTVSQITITDLIENYPGIPDGINGFDLMQLFKKQALKFDLEVIAKDVLAVKKNVSSPVVWNVTVGDTDFKALSVIASTGAHWRNLGAPGETEFAGKGVSYCATCDGPFYRDRNVIVVGGGDTAVIAAMPRIVPMPPRQGQLNGIKAAIARGYATVRDGKVGGGGTVVAGDSGAAPGAQPWRSRRARPSPRPCLPWPSFVGRIRCRPKSTAPRPRDRRQTLSGWWPRTAVQRDCGQWLEVGLMLSST